MPSAISPLTDVKALTFDVFGTVIDWLSSITDELALRVFRKDSADIHPYIQGQLEEMKEKHWISLAKEWRTLYVDFCREFDPSKGEWKTVDQHNRDTLGELLRGWGLEDLFSEQEVNSLNMVWHRMNPWDDAVPIIEELGEIYVTATLSNGNIDLLRDLNDFGSLGFQNIISAEMFRAYKPNPIVYHGAIRNLGLEPGQVAMVSSHLNDLEGARACGMRTIYVERHGEEDWEKWEEKYKEAKEWIDLWVSETEDGLLTVAKKLAELRVES